MARKPRNRDRGAQTRERILEMAAELFAVNGCGDTRLEDVANRIGVQGAALAYTFRREQELYTAVLAEAAGDLVDRTQETLKVEAPLLERLERMVALWLEAARERPWLARHRLQLLTIIHRLVGAEENRGRNGARATELRRRSPRGALR